MKKLIFSILVMTMNAISVQSQNLFTDTNSISIGLKEEFLINLFENCKVIYCDVDIDDNMQFIKKMEVEFLDTSSKYFFTAYLCSTPFDRNIYSPDVYSCDFVQMDDGGNGFELEGDHLNDLRYLKAVLDSLLYNTEFKKYTGDYPNSD